jgi:hypothetical protein
MTCKGWVDERAGLQLRKLAGNILNKQPQTNNKGWFYNLGLGSGANKPHRKKQIRYEFDLELFVLFNKYN